jgi:uncharacterized membrane protein
MSKKKRNEKTENTSNRNADKRAAKKAAVLGTEKKGRLPVIAIVAVLALSIAGGVFFMNQKGEEGSVVAMTPPSSAVSATEVRHPVSLFDDGKAHHFQHRTDDGVTVRYFILKSSDGIIRAAFDACDVCWQAGKGYSQEGDYMVCRNCGRQFASVLVNEVKGGCNPAPLNRTIVDGEVVISVANILEGRTYFDFSKGA